MTELKIVYTKEVDIKKLLARIMILVGFKPKNITDTELTLIASYIKKYFKILKLSEIQEAFEFGVSGKFDKYGIKMNTYQNFSTLYVSDVIKAYNKFNIDENRNGPKIPEIDKKPIPCLTYDEIKDHTKKSFKYYKKYGSKIDGPRWSEIYYYLKKEGEINIPEEEYKIKMYEIRDDIENELRESSKDGKTNFILSYCLSSKMMFDCECLKRVVIEYFDNKKNRN
jgi:hypothetical protein